MYVCVLADGEVSKDQRWSKRLARTDVHKISFTGQRCERAESREVLILSYRELEPRVNFQMMEQLLYRTQSEL